MLERFGVKAFKTLQDVTVDLGVVNVFVGANGTGKSNLLEAVGVLSAAASGRVNDETLSHRGVRPGLPALYKSSFKHSNAAQHIRLEADGFGASYAVSLYNPINRPVAEWRYKHEELDRNGGKVFGRSPRSQEKWNESAGLAALKAVEFAPEDPAGMLLDVLRKYAIYCPDTPTLRGLEPDPQSREPVGLAGGRLPEAVQRILYSPLGPDVMDAMFSLVGWLYGIGVSPTSLLPIAATVPQQQRALRFKDKFMAKGRDILSGYDASEGALYLLFYIVLALSPEGPRLFAIDDFDQALNPRIARDFTFQFCNWLLASGERQVLLTTHHPLVLDGLPLQDDRVRLFSVDRSKRGTTVIRRVEVSNLLLEAARGGIPLSQQWVNGHFGGVPPSV